MTATASTEPDAPDRLSAQPSRRLTFLALFVRTGTGPSAAHAWGTAKAVLDGTTCKGSYGCSHYYDPREVGGSLNLRCADGSVLGGKYYLVTFVGPPTNVGYGQPNFCNAELPSSAAKAVPISSAGVVSGRRSSKVVLSGPGETDFSEPTTMHVPVGRMRCARL